MIKSEKQSAERMECCGNPFKRKGTTRHALDFGAGIARDTLGNDRLKM